MCIFDTPKTKQKSTPFHAASSCSVKRRRSAVRRQSVSSVSPLHLRAQICYSQTRSCRVNRVKAVLPCRQCHSRCHTAREKRRRKHKELFIWPPEAHNQCRCYFCVRWQLSAQTADDEEGKGRSSRFNPLYADGLCGLLKQNAWVNENEGYSGKSNFVLFPFSHKILLNAFDKRQWKHWNSARRGAAWSAARPNGRGVRQDWAKTQTGDAMT